jgi:hypothetical protein
VTEAQLHGTSVPGSRYQFKPSTTLGLPMGGGVGAGAGSMLPAASAPSSTYRYSSPVAAVPGTVTSKLAVKPGSAGAGYSPKTVVTPLPGRAMDPAPYGVHA